MTFLLDENFPKAAASVLHGMEHEVFDVREMGMAGCTDAAVLAKAEELGAVLLTTDRDFFHTLQHRNSQHPGVIIIALRKPCRAVILERLGWFLMHVSSEQWAGRAFQLRDTTWVAKPPMQQ
jgi:predicted nuclease of predicted toxin-antitoxin system